jgi:hypothetical protein
MSDPEARTSAIADLALNPKLIDEVAQNNRIREERLKKDFPTAPAPEPLILDKNRSKSSQLFNQRNLERDADAINFKSEKDRKRRDNILGSNDFSDFVRHLGEKGVNSDPRDMDFNTLKRLSDDYRYNRPRRSIPSTGQQTMSQRIDDRNATIQNPNDQFTGYAGPSTNNKLIMVSRNEAERLSAFDDPYTSAPLTEEQGRESFWDSGNFKNKENWF